MAVVTTGSDFGAQKNKVCHCFHCFPIYLPWSDRTRCQILVFWWSFTPTFSFSSFTFIKRLFNSSSLSAFRVVSSVYLRLLIFILEILVPAELYLVWHFVWCTLHISCINRVTIHSFVLLSQFWTRPLFHVQFCCFLTCIQVSQETSSALVFPYL